MAIRMRLGTRAAREDWLGQMILGKVDVEDIKLALGLRVQHAAREGRDGGGAGWQLMENMAACKYEGIDGFALLHQDLEALAAALPSTTVPTMSSATAGLDKSAG